MAAIEKRTNKTGETSFRVKVRLKGFPVQTATFKRLTDAKRWGKQTESAILEGRHFKTVEAKRHTLNELIDRYLQYELPKKKHSSSRKQKTQLKWWKDQIGSYTLADVTPALIAECRDKLLSEPIPVSKFKKRKPKLKKEISEELPPKLRGPSTAVRYLAALSHAFTIAMKEWGWVEDNPCRKVTKPKEPNGRVRFLSDEERTRLLNACKSSTSDDLYIAAVLALSTGARKMEIMSLRWDQVDFQRHSIILHETKNNERRAIPLVGLAFDLLKDRSKVRRIDLSLVFPGKNLTTPVDLRTPWETALKRANIEDFRWHDLRHSCASYLAMNGATLAEIAEILGHKTLSMVKRYAHLSDVHTAGVLARMNTKIFCNEKQE